jgi:hypothetical protein
MINWEILGNPVNWLLVTLIIVFTFMAAYTIYEAAATAYQTPEK